MPITTPGEAEAGVATVGAWFVTVTVICPVTPLSWPGCRRGRTVGGRYTPRAAQRPTAAEQGPGKLGLHGQDLAELVPAQAVNRWVVPVGNVRVLNDPVKGVRTMSVSVWLTVTLTWLVTLRPPASVMVTRTP